MKQRLLALLMIAMVPMAADAQLKGILNKVKNKSNQRANNKVDEAIDKGLDAVEGKNNSGNTTSTTTPAATPASTPVATEEGSAVKSFSKYDFIPGDSVLYYDNFEGEALAELPTNWNTSGTGEVVTLDKYPGNWLRMHKTFTYLSSNVKDFGENYTMEFDMILQLKNNGWMYPQFNVGLFAVKEISHTDNVFLKNNQWRRDAAIVATVYPGEFKSSRVKLNSYIEHKPYFQGDAKSLESIEKCYGKPVHIAIQVQKERFRMWINEEKVFDVPKGIPAGATMNQVLFEIGHTNYPEEGYGVYVSNIKVATGRPDTRHKLIEEGKFSTTGILFDFQSAVIKPESYAVVKEIAGVLQQHSSLRIKVLGHTSSDGDDKANMELSQKRAAAVKDLLASEFNIDASRIETEGKGETQPIADNKSKEGKAQNRRVEFIKL
jgi:OOP family OmpA-OmpF porin